MSMKLLSEQPTIHENCVVTNSTLGAWTELGANTEMEEVEFGDYSYTAGDVQMMYTTVGKFCSIASHVRINPSNHPMWRVTQHHATYRRMQYGFMESDDEDIFDWRREDHVQIGHDVWIGHGAIIMPGVKIGTGAVVGAGAVVTKDIPPYMIAVGVPAKPLRERFPRHIAEQLLAIQWWNWDRETLKERFEELDDVESFIKRYGG